MIENIPSTRLMTENIAPTRLGKENIPPTRFMIPFGYISLIWPFNFMLKHIFIFQFGSLAELSRQKLGKLEKTKTKRYMPIYF
jgi:hypothetical protein